MRDSFCARVIADPSALLSLGKVRALLAGRVDEGEIEEKAQALLDAAAKKRLGEGQTVVIALEGLDAEERERYVRMAHASNRPRHLILLEAGKDKVAEDDRAALGELRTQARRGRPRAGGLRHVAAARRGDGVRDEADRLRPAAARRLTATRTARPAARSARRRRHRRTP